MKALSKKRLLNVAKALRESPVPKAFSMALIAYDGGSNLGQVHPCGTPGCAMGHYAARHDLQRTFRLDKKGDLGNWFHKAMDHFGITDDEAGQLFFSSGCGYAQTAIQAANFIERFVARKAKES